MKLTLSTLVPFFTGNMKPACVIKRTPCRNWYDENNMVMDMVHICTVSNLLSQRPVVTLKISHILPVINVNKLRTVVAKNCWATIAFLIDCIAYSHPSVSLTCLDQSSLVSAWYCKKGNKSEVYVHQDEQVSINKESSLLTCLHVFVLLFLSLLKRLTWYPDKIAIDDEISAILAVGDTAFNCIFLATLCFSYDVNFDGSVMLPCLHNDGQCWLIPDGVVNAQIEQSNTTATSILNLL
jgi:hypothetical protein